MGVRGSGIRMVEDRTGEMNKKPTKCDWCDVQLISYQGYRVQMTEDDPFDYQWACHECYEKVWL
jgi:uncharacterized protein with PIN domain